MQPLSKLSKMLYLAPKLFSHCIDYRLSDLSERVGPYTHLEKSYQTLCQKGTWSKLGKNLTQQWLSKGLSNIQFRLHNISVKAKNLTQLRDFFLKYFEKEKTELGKIGPNCRPCSLLTQRLVTFSKCDIDRTENSYTSLVFGSKSAVSHAK